VAEAPVAKVSINAIVGPPDPLSRQLQQEFASALEQNRVAVAGKNERADFALRPFVLAAKDRQGTKVSYVMDVYDPSGKRVNRSAGEERVPASPTKDPWGAITPAVAKVIAAKATGTFINWLPGGSNGAVASVGSRPSGVGVAKDRPARPAARSKSAMASSAQTTGSIYRAGTLTAMVPTVTGAPGDGKTSLTAAIQRELRGKGITVADRPVRGSYRVEGAVTMGAARGGRQPIRIEWVVKDPQGKKLGTVSQKNEIPEGQLDGAWGKVADQAASAAMQGILKLLPSSAGAVN
jgi:hypothetical protein